MNCHHRGWNASKATQVRTIWYGLGPILCVVAVILAPMLIGYLVVQPQLVRQDQAALPYLMAAAYLPEAGCPSVWNPGLQLPVRCARPRYRILSIAVAKQFGLPPRKPRSDGWYRIGPDAINLECWGQCTAVNVVRNAFGH